MKTSALGGVGAGASIARPIYRITGLRVGVLPVRYTACLVCRRAYMSSRLCIALLAVKCGSNCRPTFGGSWGWLTARMCGVGPYVGTFQNRLHPSGGGNDISRAGGFGTLKNARIASGMRGIVRVRIWGGSAVFFTKDHGQRTTVSAAGVGVIFRVQP